MVDRQLRQRVDDGKGETLGQRDRLAARQWMLARDDCTEAKPFQGDLAQIRRMAQRHGDADVGLAAAQGLQHIRLIPSPRW